MNALFEHLSRLLLEYPYFGPIIAFIGGFLTSLTPCSLPIIPLLVGYLSSSSLNRHQSLRFGILYACGVVFMVTLLGIAASFFGKIFNQQSKLFYLTIGIILLLMAVQTSGFYQFVPTKMLKLNKIQGGMTAFVSGMLMSIFSSPCATPILIVFLSLATLTQNIFYVLLLFLFFGLGQSVLLVLASFSIGYFNQVFVSKSNAKISLIAKWLLVVLITLAGLYFIYMAV